MTRVTRQLLHAYLDDALSDVEMATVERALRDSDDLRQSLRQALAERDRGEHTLGAVWRRERLTCPTREQLGNFLLQALDDGIQDYLKFHLEIVGCSFCQANLVDLQARMQEPAPQARQRRRRFFETSAGLLGTPNE
jgi:hypothetical protein